MFKRVFNVFFHFLLLKRAIQNGKRAAVLIAKLR